MDVDWRAIGLGFGVSVLVGLLSGFTIPLLDITLPAVSYSTAGVSGGFVAGYYATSSLKSGILHGALASAIGALLVGIVLVFFTASEVTLVGLGGVIGSIFGVLIAVPLAGIPGAVGGVVGSYINRRNNRRATNEDI